MFTTTTSKDIESGLAYGTFVDLEAHICSTKATSIEPSYDAEADMPYDMESGDGAAHAEYDEDTHGYDIEDGLAETEDERSGPLAKRPHWGKGGNGGLKGGESMSQTQQPLWDDATIQSMQQFYNFWSSSTSTNLFNLVHIYACTCRTYN